MMPKGLFGGPVRPRPFKYVPRYYNPEKDTDRRDRFRFDQGPLRRKYYRARSGRNPFVLLILILVVVALIWLMNSDILQSHNLEKASFSPADVPAQTSTTTTEGETAN